MAYMSAREMLSGLPVKMAEGGVVSANQSVLDFINNNPDASAEAIATQITNSGADLYALADALNIDRSVAQEAYDEANAVNQYYLDAEKRLMAEINADPAAFNAADAYKEILIADAASERGVNVQGALDAGVARSTIDRVFTTPAGSPAYTGPAPTATMSASVQDYYNTVMADDKIDAAERLAMQKIATDQGLSYADIVAAGVDPNILYNTPAVEPIAPVVPDPVVPVVPDPFPQTQAPYTAPTVYQPLPDNTSVYAAGEESLDRTFRDSAPRTEIIDAYGGLVNFDYSPGASLTSATGSGYNFTPPTVTSRPRSLMGADQLGRYTGGRSAADLRQLTTGLGNGRTYSDYAGVLQNPGSYSGGLSKSQLYSRMRGLDYQLDAAAAADRQASTTRGNINAYLAANPDIAASYASQKDRLGAQSLEQFARNHYNTTGRAEMAANKRGDFILVESTGGGGVDPLPRIDYGSGLALGSGMGGYEGEGEDYSTSNFTKAMELGKAGRVLRPFAQGGPVKKPQGFADGGTAAADLEALDPTDPLFITETVQEVNPDMVKREIPPFVFDGVERPTGQEASKNMLENILSGAGKIPESVANYFVRPDETGGPSLVSPRQVGSDVAALGGAMKEGLKEDPVGFALDVLPVTGEIRSGMDVDKFSTMANEARAAGDTKAADLYQQIVTLSAAGAVPLLGMGARAGRRAAINAAEEAIKKGSVTEASKLLNDLDPSVKYEGMRDATVQRLKDKGIMSDEELRIAELDGYAEDPKFTYSIDDSGSNSSYITLKKTTDYDEEYGVLDSDEYTIRFSDHSLPSQYSFDRNMYNVSNDYLDETINGKSLEDAIDYVDRLVPATESAKMLDEVDVANAPRLELPEIGRPVRASEYTPAEFKAITRNMHAHQADVTTPAEMVARAERIEPGFQTAIRSITDDLGLIKSETFGVKQVKSLENKLKRGYELGTVTDPIRTRILINTAQEADEVVDRITQIMPLQDRGVQQHTTSGYFDRKLNVMYTDANGEKLLGEIQITTPEMLEAVESTGHRLYEVERALTERYGEIIPTTHIRRFENMQRAQKELYQGVAERVDPSIVNSIQIKPKKDLVDTSTTTPTTQKKRVTETQREAWRETNKGNFRQKQTPELALAAEKLGKGEITIADYAKEVKRLRPIEPFTSVPKTSTFEEIASALNKDQVDKGLIGLDKEIADGTPVGSRLDIPAYNKYDTWVVSVHAGTGVSGKSLGYGKVAVLDNVSFNSNPNAAYGVATGSKDKAPFARMNGKWRNVDPEAARKQAEEYLTDPDWVQVGMNPYRHSFFYDKATGQPLASADEVIQIGPLVLARNSKTRPLESSEHAIKNPKKGQPTHFKKGGSIERVYNEQTYI